MALSFSLTVCKSQRKIICFCCLARCFGLNASIYELYNLKYCENWKMCDNRTFSSLKWAFSGIHLRTYGTSFAQNQLMVPYFDRLKLLSFIEFDEAQNRNSLTFYLFSDISFAMFWPMWIVLLGLSFEYCHAVCLSVIAIT